MRVICHVHGLGSSCTSKQNVLFLILLILTMELTNKKRGICRHRIFYPLRFEPPFSNDVIILKLKVGLEPNQMKFDLTEVFMENITYFWNK